MTEANAILQRFADPPLKFTRVCYDTIVRAVIIDVQSPTKLPNNRLIPNCIAVAFRLAKKARRLLANRIFTFEEG